MADDRTGGHRRAPTRASRSQGFVARALGLGGTFLVGCSVLAGSLTTLAGCVDCFDYGERIFFDRGAGKVVLDADHPMAEQLVTVHINAASLPTTGTTEATLIVTSRAAVPTPSGSPATVPPSASPRGSPRASPRSAAPTATTSTDPLPTEPMVRPEFTLIRDVTNEVVPMMIPWGGASTGRSFGAVVLTVLDCPLGADCDRTYRLRVAVPDLAAGQTVSSEWQVGVHFSYTGVTATCGTPDGGSATVETTKPEAAPRFGAAFGKPVTREETAGGVLARHVTLTSSDPPTAAALRLAMSVGSGRWVRVIPDGTSAPAASELVGFSSTGAPRGGLADAPVLGDCPAAGPCQSGYWIVFQDYNLPTPGAPAPPPETAHLSWSAAVTAAFSEGTGLAPPAVRLTLDDLDAGLVPGVTLDQAADELPLKTNKVATVIDAAFSIPARPASTNGLDPMAASIVVVHVEGRADGLVPRLEGDGAESVTGYFRGDGSANLLAHPFDRCPPTGPCTVTLRLVAAWTDVSSGFSSASRVTWSVSVLGGPPGTTVTFGSPYQLPTP